MVEKFKIEPPKGDDLVQEFFSHLMEAENNVNNEVEKTNKVPEELMVS
jgi:hypothetical protein